MKNVLYTEYIEAIVAETEKFRGSCPSHISVERNGTDVRFSSGDDLVSCAVVLENNGNGGEVRAWVRGPCASGDPAYVMAVAKLEIDVIGVAMVFKSKIDGLRVWVRDCPCDYCSGTGGHSGGCRHCDGTGIRNIKPVE